MKIQNILPSQRTVSKLQKAPKAHSFVEASANSTPSKNILPNWQYYQNSIAFKGKDNINFDDDGVTRDFNWERMYEIIDKFEHYGTRFESDAKIYDNGDRYLYTILYDLMKAKDYGAIKALMERLDRVGPVGYKPLDRTIRPIPKFAVLSQSKYTKDDIIPVLKNFIYELELPVADEEWPIYLERRNALKEKQSHSEEYNKKKALEEEFKSLMRLEQIENIKESAKKQLRPFIKRFSNVMRGKDAVLPNCILIHGSDRESMYIIMNWLRKSLADANFEYLHGRYENPDTMQEKFIKTLENAEKYHRLSGNYSLVFAPNLDSLINPSVNSKENIAAMKEYLETALEDYHSVVIFATSQDNLSKLDKGALQANRVGLFVDMEKA